MLGWTFLAIIFLSCLPSKANKKLVFDHHEVKYQNSDYVRVNVSVTTNKAHSTAANVELVVLKYMDKLEAKMMVYRFIDNEYKPTAFKYEGDGCSFLKILNANVYHIREDKWSNFITSCPLKQGQYHLNDIDVNGQGMEFSFLPLWKCKIEMEYSTHGTLIYKALTFVDIVDK